MKPPSEFAPGGADRRRPAPSVDKYEDYLHQRRERERAMASEPPVTALYLEEVILKTLDERSGKTGGWTVEGPLATGRDSWVFRVHTALAPWPLAVKVHCSATPGEQVEKRFHQLQRYHRAMAGGDAAVPAPWAVLPEHRTLISEWIGEPVIATLLRRAGWRRGRRSDLFKAAGRWLGCFHGHAGVAAAPLDPVRLQWHVDRSLGAVEGGGNGAGDAVFRLGYAMLVSRADEFSRVLVDHTTCHGDFTPNNLFHGPERTVAIDFGASNELPVSFDFCRFLVYAEISKPFVSRKARLSPQGIERLDQEAFMAGYGRLKQPLDTRVFSYLHLAEVLRRWASLMGQQPGSRISPAHWLRLVRLRRMAAYAVHSLERDTR